ncbi:MAG: hypothetical protein HWN67_17050 [Candidatus Helarchaeota archaeon]|nr:hypothetical protein [Candidatus Helarchaeota archaeon]
MKENNDSLFAIGLYLIVIGFVDNNHHHKFNYIEKLFFWYSIGGEPVKATCYNLMIPIQTTKPAEIIRDYDVIHNQKEIKQPKLLENKAGKRFKLTDFLDTKILIKIYLLSFQPKLIGAKACKRLSAFRGRNSSQIDGRKIPP